MAKVRKSPLLPIFLIVAVDILGLTIILPLLPFYAEKYGATPLIVGLLSTLFALCQLISGPFLGAASDRIGRKPLLLISQFGTLIGFLVLGFASSLWMVFLSRIIDGATAGNLSVAQAYISDVTEPKNRAKAFGIIGIAFGLGFLIGPAISGFLSQYGYQYPAFAAAALSATSILTTHLLLPNVKPDLQTETGPGGKRLSVLDWKAYLRFFRRPELASLLNRFFLFCMAFSLFVSGFALFAERRYTWNGLPYGPKEVGYVFAYAGLLGIILQGGLIGRLVKRFGEERLARVGFLTAAIGYAGLGFTGHVADMLIVNTIASFGNGVLRPALSSLISQNSGRLEQGTVMGLTQSLNSVAQIIAPLIGGLLIESNFLIAWALAAATAAALGLILSMRALPPAKRA